MQVTVPSRHRPTPYALDQRFADPEATRAPFNEHAHKDGPHVRQLVWRFSKPTRHAHPWPTAFRHNRDTLDPGRPIGGSAMPNLLGERLLARPCRAKRRRRIGERVEPERPQEATFADSNAPYFAMAGHVRSSSSMHPDCPWSAELEGQFAMASSRHRPSFTARRRAAVRHLNPIGRH